MVTSDHRLPRVFHTPVLDHAYLESGSAHVCGDHILIAHQLGEKIRRDDASGGAAFDHSDRTVRRFLGRQQAAIALHDHDRASVAVLREFLFQVKEIVFDDLAGVGINCCRRGPLIFSRHSGCVTRERHLHVGRDPLDDVADFSLMG
jgi:hypothetical protein